MATILLYQIAVFTFIHRVQVSSREKSVIPIENYQILTLFWLLNRSQPNFLMRELLQVFHSRVFGICLMIDRLIFENMILWSQAIRAFRIFCCVFTIIEIFFDCYFAYVARSNRLIFFFDIFKVKFECRFWIIRLYCQELLFAESSFFLFPFDYF